MINPLPLLIASNIQNAIDGGYDFSDYTDEELAGDLCAYAADLEDYEYEEILKYVKIQRRK